MARLNKLLTGHQITDEVINRADSTSLPLGHDTFLATGVVVRTAAGGGGTLLTLTTDYTLGSEDARLTTEAGATVYTKLAVVNGAYQSTNLYVTYKTVGDYASVESVESVASPVGAMVMFAGAVAPDGWMLCQGQAVSRSTYARLFASIGTTWGVGNGSTTFNLPDMRGAAPAGVGTSTGYTQNETLALGTKYNDQMHGHTHDIYDGLSTGGDAKGPSSANATYQRILAALSGYSAGDPVSDGTNGTPRTGNVTRGKRIGLNFIIKY